MYPAFYKQLSHELKKPVSVERIHPDKLAINGVHYDGDYFRTFANPETDVLYAVRKDEDGCVRLVVIDSLEKAMDFFEEIGAFKPDPDFDEHIECAGDDDAL